MVTHISTYETLFILDSNHYARDPNGVGKSVAAMIEEVGGKVLVSRLWAEQKLAYPIDGHFKGTYWLAYFEMEGTKLTELNRACQLSESIVRHMSLKLDKRLVEPMVAHARGESISTEGTGEESTEVEAAEVAAT
ncbi:30S ribosomal protein S6 [Rosistilla oblonga]|uniref:Small ribosomal subunit protein bS6 n=1 Tax=Rosistilla oblonga TaxID=2527990 RepID=A0A518IR84_9BACT|nr:30S ribosomal protein S6 [Rosistilla oblonga]QDV11617.1 30S ribosomal protein S6 [Rosistilla oblonga]QDV55607.1 30S ribosomal protein S6 [Rosistilla oblonga]